MSNFAGLIYQLYRHKVYSYKVYSFCPALIIAAILSISNRATGSTVVFIDGDSNRYPIALEEETSVKLCNLIVDDVYVVSFSPDFSQAVTMLLEGGANTNNSNHKIQFKASSTCMNLNFITTTSQIVGDLSVIKANKRKAASRSSDGIQTNKNYAVEQLVKDIFIGGDCFEVKNISFKGNSKALGFFEEGSTSINIERGVMLSTGDIANARGPNVSTRISTDFEDNFTQDKDLENLLNNRNTSLEDGSVLDFDTTGKVTLEDVAVLEFDFTPTTKHFQFEYAFASEEYCDYVGSKFNDVFGFFLSGPGIDGPFENKAINIAFVPGTSDFVAINNINHLSNEKYFVNNVPEGQVQFVPCDKFPKEGGVATELIEFDGFTTVLSAVANVIPCETYHIKLAITDASDALFDSAVFLKANSFNAGGTAYVSRYLPDMDTEEAFEGCTESYFLFERTDDNLEDSLVVYFNLSEESTAIAGEDYETLPNSVIILPGQETLLLPIKIYTDKITEGKEHLIMELESACSCADLSIDLTINDFIPFTVARQTNSICGKQEVQIAPNINGGIGALKYQWNTGDTSAILAVYADTSAIYTLTVTDVCANSAITSSKIEVLNAPTATLTDEKVVCDLSEPVFFDIELGDTGPWQIDYTINGIPQSTLHTENAHFKLAALQEGVYELQEVTNQTCTNKAEGTATLVVAQPKSATIEVVQPLCEGDKGTINIIGVRGGIEPYLFSIDGGENYKTIPSFNLLEAGFYEVVIQDQTGCEWREEYEIVSPENLSIELEEKAKLILGEAYDLAAYINVSNSKIQTAEWSPSEGIECLDCLFTSVVPLRNTRYKVTIMDNRGCTKTAAIDLIVKKDYKVFVPNAFSPNGDGKNDLFYINANSEQIVEIHQFQVINRWGDLMYSASHFQPNDPQFGWDGTYNGNLLNAQVFAYVVEIEFIDGEIIVFKGDVTLVDYK